MEERAKIPVSLPHPSPTLSYWQEDPSDIANLRSSSELSSVADYVIIGSGISGTCIAYNILSKHPDSSVVMLEARQACSGATGRNGGHTKAASYRSFLDHERELGLDEAIKIARMEHANIRATHAFARDHGIDCASTECDTVDIIYSETLLAMGRNAIARMKQTMAQTDPAALYQEWDAQETDRKFLTPGALGSFQYAAGSLSAYAFTAGVLKIALRKGLNLQTSTPAEALDRSQVNGRSVWTVKTPRGEITAPHVILAINGYSAHLLQQMQGLIVPLHGQVVAQRPGLSLPQRGLETTYSFIYEKGYEYMITRPPGSTNEGDIIIGGGLHQLPNSGASRYGSTDDSSLDPTVTAYLRGCAVASFGSNWGSDNPAGRIKREWSGVMGATADGLPYVGEMPDMPGLWISAGFNGHGMVLCLKSAEALVERIIGDEAGKEAVTKWFPRSMIITKDRMKTAKFTGRKDLRAPAEAEFGERS